jgi:hypothetical protein
MAIVTTAYRYKRPPRKRKAVALEAPAVVTVRDRKRAAKTGKSPTLGNSEAAPPPANDHRKSVIVSTTSRKRLKLLRADKRAVNPDPTFVSPHAK